jgi:hypothetical protein
VRERGERERRHACTHTTPFVCVFGHVIRLRLASCCFFWFLIYFDKVKRKGASAGQQSLREEWCAFYLWSFRLYVCVFVCVCVCNFGWGEEEERCNFDKAGE